MIRTVKKALNNLGTRDISKVLKKIDKYHYVSFDIFDTLIKRDVPDPRDVFNLIEKKNGFEGFCARRIEAEIKARQESAYEEVTLKEIYDYFPEEVREQYATAEIEIEKQLCIRNEVMYQVFRSCISDGKKVVLTTDMYLPQKTIEEILEGVGITGYHKLFVSGSIKRTKASGNLYTYVTEALKIKPEQLIHIGDSFRSDYIMALKKRVMAVKIPRKVVNCCFYSKDHSIYDSYLSQFISNHVASMKDDYYARFGYECLGPLLYGFINWMHQDAKRCGVKRIYFLSRDGYIMKCAYEEMRLQEDIPCEYFEASRRSLRIPFLRSISSREDLVDELMMPLYTSIGEVLNVLGLNADEYEDVVIACDIKMDAVYRWEQLKSSPQFDHLLDKLSEAIFRNSDSEMKAFERYIRQFSFEERVAIVDIGWRGSMQKYLSVCLNGLKIPSTIYGYYLGLSHDSIENLKGEKYTAKGYLFDCLNSGIDISDNQAYSGLLESFFLEPKGSVERYVINKDSGLCELIRSPYEYEFEKETEENIQSIQINAIEFIRDIKCNPIETIMKKGDKATYERRMLSLLRNPKRRDVEKFGNIPFYNNGKRNKLASPEPLVVYFHHPRKLLSDFGESKWKTGFMRALCRIPLNYYYILRLMLKRRYHQ